MCASKIDKKTRKSKPDEAMEITRVEPVILQMEKDGRVCSHLILFEINCRIGVTKEELVVDGDVQETIYEMREREY